MFSNLTPISLFYNSKASFDLVINFSIFAIEYSLDFQLESLLLLWETQVHKAKI